MRLLLLFVPSLAFAQLWSGILATNRAVDWSAVGVPGGIPTRATCSTISASTYGNGASDATAGIQSALNACASGQAVELGAGTFRINTSLTIPSNRTLRGVGAQSTILTIHGTGNAINLGNDTAPSYGTTTVTVSSGATAGSTSIVVSSATNFAVGRLFSISRTNDTSVTNVGEGGQTCTWCDPFSGARLEGQTVRITNVAGTTITFSPALYRDYSTGSPNATPFIPNAEFAGVEKLQIYANNTGYTSNIHMRGCYGCWVKGIEGNFADGDHVRVMNSLRSEVRDSYFTGAFVRTAGSTDAVVFIATYSSANLIENNILERLHSSIMLNWGASGNVIAANYSFGAFTDLATNFLTSDIVLHGAHPSFNLFESNIGANFTADSTWGSSSHNTVYRNWWLGTTKVATPYTGRGTINYAGATWGVQHVRGIELCFAQRDYNLVGNVVGSSDTAALLAYNIGAPLTQVTQVTAPTNRSYDSAAYGYTFGYSGATDTGTAPEDSSLPFSTAMRHGDYEYTRNSVVWDGTTTQTLPASFYRSSAPTWWGTVPWPAIGPDVTGGLASNRGYAYRNPAMSCYNSTSKLSDGTLNFEADSCYAAVATTGTKPVCGRGLELICR